MLKTHFAANSSWKNWILFYLPLFDDYLKVYYIQDREFCIQPSGFSVNEGLCLISKEENEKLFLDVIQRLEIELGLTVLREA